MSTGGISLRVRRGVDGIVYAVSLAAVVFVIGTVLCLPLGWGWTGVKYWLFFLGLLLFGIGTLKLRPRAAWKDYDTDGGEEKPETESRFEQATRTALPDDLTVRHDERWSGGARVFLSSLAVLGASMAMEFVFGVGG
ncbi:DUF7555 family protein [Halostella pelagica]|uniref:DUF7555 family protein n=1 Tax=Halostella pelagica TaxID=2583824 RepID=UPI0010801AEB|nr:hypothetical protein [Halostella pelagica]